MQRATSHTRGKGQTFTKDSLQDTAGAPGGQTPPHFLRKADEHETTQQYLYRQTPPGYWDCSFQHQVTEAHLLRQKH